MQLTLTQSLTGLMDAERKLSSKEAINNPTLMSAEMYRLGQYTAAVENFLAEAEEEYENNWAAVYNVHLKGEPIVDVKPLSATAAKQQADVDTADMKGNIKKLSRYVGAAWKVHMSCMARIKHLEAEGRGAV